MKHKARVLVFADEIIEKVGAGMTWSISNHNLTGPDVRTGADVYITSAACSRDTIHGWTKIKYKVRFEGNIKLESSHNQWQQDHWNKHKMNVQELDTLSTKFLRKKLVAWSWLGTEELDNMWAKCSSADKDTILPHHTQPVRRHHQPCCHKLPST